MKIVFILIFIFFFTFFPFFRMFIKNIPFEYYYVFSDLALYIKEKKWQLFGYYGIDSLLVMKFSAESLVIINSVS